MSLSSLQPQHHRYQLLSLRLALPESEISGPEAESMAAYAPCGLVQVHPLSLGPLEPVLTHF